MSYLDRVRAELAALERRTLRRALRTHVPDGAVDFSSNDYLGLRRDPRVIAALHGANVAGSGGSRLLGGAAPEYGALERELAVWTGRQRALLFSSGYLAALGAIVTLARSVDLAYADALVHACAIDALRLTKLPRHIIAHATVPLRAPGTGGALIVTESLFGMDGSEPPLSALVATLRAGDLLVVDEAHALGVAGREGAGLAATFDDDRVVVIGTLSKALGAAGGFVAGPADAIALLATAARTFVFDTALPLAVVAAARAAVAIIRSTEGDRLRARLGANARRAREGLTSLGFAIPAGDGAIIPVIIGDAAHTLDLAGQLEGRGVFAPAIRPPTVPDGTSRLRISVRADHECSDIEALLGALADMRLTRR